jgi:hypothetical protein
LLKLRAALLEDSLLFHDLGILEHGDTAALSELAFHRDRFARVLGELVVDRFVIADNEVSFPLREDAYRTVAFDALRGASSVFFSSRVVIDVAHHIDHFAGDFFVSGGVKVLLARFVGGKQRRAGQRRDEASRDCYF